MTARQTLGDRAPRVQRRRRPVRPRTDRAEPGRRGLASAAALAYLVGTVTDDRNSWEASMRSDPARPVI